MNMFSRESLVKQIDTRPYWDVIILGGGATGLGIALDSATRGYATLLIEQADFAKGTSSRSTKLVHGGVRYLAQGNIGLVREALLERGLMRQNAPHLVHNQSFIIPNYHWGNSLTYTLGLTIYDLLSGKHSLGKVRYIDKEETLARLKTITPERLQGGVLYHDGQFDDSRFAVNLAQTSIENGAVVLNYFKALGLLKKANGEITGVLACDEESDATYELKSKVVFNATGVFADHILKMDNPQANNTIRPSQGVHLVLDQSFLPGKDAIMIPKTEDGRVLFIVPWKNKLIAGTTDTLVSEPRLEPVPLDEEIEFILSTVNKYLVKAVSRTDVHSLFAGLRPLALSQRGTEKTKEISRSHKIMVSSSGLISIAGGKWTTYRKMAQDAIDKAISIGKLPKRACLTATFRIHGAMDGLEASDPLSVYGADREKIQESIALFPELGKKLHPDLPYLWAEVRWAIRHEMARTLEDVLARRLRGLFTDARATIHVAPMVAGMLADELGKSTDWQQQQVNAFTKMAGQYIL